MNKKSFSSLVAAIKARCEGTAHATGCQYRLELVTESDRRCKPEHRVGNYVDLEHGFSIEEGYVRFRVLPDPGACWTREIKEVFLLLPYSSIAGIVEIVEDCEGQQQSRFQMLVAEGVCLDCM